MTPPVELCFGCMETRDPSGFCPYCGYRQGTQPTSPLYLKPGTVLQGQYIVGRVLGHGGFGVTYLGFDSILQRKIAIKEYLPSSLASRHTDSSHLSVHYEQLRGDFDFGLQRFLEEARTLARFQGVANIIGVLNFFSANGTAYMVMEYLEGETFECYLARQKGRISFAAARAILMPVMDALREIHKQGILHRDISPDNIFLVNQGPVKLLDFGAARQAMSMRNQGLSVIVKEGYAPEEQYSAKAEQGPWTDVYALAGTMYRAITGHIPALSLERRLTGDLTLPSLLGSDIPPESELVLMRALALDAADRYRTVDEFQSALAAVSGAGAANTVRRQTQETQLLSHEHALKTPPVFVPPVPAARPTVPAVQPARPKPTMRAILGVLLLLGLGYAGYRNFAKPHVAGPGVVAFSSVRPGGVDTSKPNPFPAEPEPPPSGSSIPSAPPPGNTETPSLPANAPPTGALPTGASSTGAPQNEFLVFHEHGGLSGIVGHSKSADFTGVLAIADGRVTYRSASPDQRWDDFDQPLSAIVEARKNRLSLQGKQAFHIRFKNGQNYNFEPRNASVEAVIAALPQKRGK